MNKIILNYMHFVINVLTDRVGLHHLQMQNFIKRGYLPNATLMAHHCKNNQITLKDNVHRNILYTDEIILPCTAQESSKQMLLSTNMSSGSS